MTPFTKPDAFWQALDRLVNSSEIKIDRPAGSVHPRLADMIYPLDYGYLNTTRSNDGGNLDVWIGSRPEKTLVGALLTVDLGKREAEIKLLLGCTTGDMAVITQFCDSHGMAAYVILRKEKHEINPGSLS